MKFDKVRNIGIFGCQFADELNGFGQLGSIQLGANNHELMNKGGDEFEEKLLLFW